MSQNTRQFWLSAVGAALGVLAVFTAFGIWLWTTGGSTAVLIDRLGRVEHRVDTLETNGKANRELLLEISNDVKWIKGPIPGTQGNR